MAVRSFYFLAGVTRLLLGLASTDMHRSRSCSWLCPVPERRVDPTSEKGLAGRAESEMKANLSSAFVWLRRADGQISNSGDTRLLALVGPRSVLKA